MSPIKHCLSARIRALLIAIAGWSVIAPTMAHALSIVLNDTGGAGSGTQAYQGFRAAADTWESLLFDPVTARIDIGYKNLGSPFILGQAQSFTTSGAYESVVNELAARRSSVDDFQATSVLQPGSSLSFFTTDANGNFVFDNDGSANNATLDVNRPNAKALGLLGDDGLADASITLNSTFSWDFNRNDGIGSGLWDFTGVALHEIGHALGFRSGVDQVDAASLPNGPQAPTNLNDFRVFTPLDLFRTSTVAGGLPDLSVGGSPYFSIDGGVTNLGNFSTGEYNGDGRQASHWKDNQGLGAMDPTTSSGELVTLTTRDIQAFDVMGWNLFQQTSNSLSGNPTQGGGMVASIPVAATVAPYVAMTFDECQFGTITPSAGPATCQSTVSLSSNADVSVQFAPTRLMQSSRALASAYTVQQETNPPSPSISADPGASQSAAAFMQAAQPIGLATTYVITGSASNDPTTTLAGQYSASMVITVVSAT